MKNIHYYIVFVILFSWLGCLSANAQQEEKLILSYTISPDDYIQSLSDVKITPNGGWASSVQSSEPIRLSFDGNYSTIYHSSWSMSSSDFPVTLKYYFDDAEQIDYIVYHPRSSGTNGNFKEVSLEYTDTNDVDHVIGDYDCKGSSSLYLFAFDTPLKDVKEVRFIVKSGVGDNGGVGYVSCAEMEFYLKISDQLNLSDYFTDDTYSELKEGITLEMIYAASDIPVYFKQLASDLADEKYKADRIKTHEPYRPINELADELKLSTYNSFENPTGIMFQTGKPVVLFVPNLNGEAVSVINRNWNTERQESFSLTQGINYITPTMDGLTYISYYTTNYKTAEPLRIHIRGGAVNGVFEKGINNNEDWVNLLANAATNFLDIKGDYINLTYQLTGLKRYCPTDGTRLIELHDEIVAMEYELMGFFKYDRVPKNHMFAANTYGSHLPYAGGLGAMFPDGSASQVCSPTNIVTGDNSWVIAHELGHVNQIRPGLKWVGTTECTNNVYSSYVQYNLTKNNGSLSLRLEHESCNPISGEASVIGGRFNSHLHYALIEGQNWLRQWGQDGQSDHFVKLVPLWQLNLYYKIAKNTSWHKPDWYADISEAAIVQNDAGLTNGQHQINFIKRACLYTEADLTEFFERAGLLKPINISIDDYGVQQLTITEAMCQEVRDYVTANGWQKPTGVINYISGNTVNIYDNQLAVEGTLNAGVTGSGTSRTVSHSVWKNAVVYKTYNGDELLRITMAGTGYTNNSATVVPYPNGATKIVAVSWDGKETTVYNP